MTDLQILTLTIAIVFPALAIAGSIAASLYAHRRLDAFSKAMDQRFEQFEKRIVQHVDNGFEHMELLLKLHVAEHHKS